VVDVRYPDAEKIVLVWDNYVTHAPASLYKAFPPEEARRLLNRLEIRYTPKHGSWLDMAEIELSVLTKQCLARRISDIDILQHETKGLGRPPQRFPNRYRLAVHHCRRTDQTEAPLPAN